MIESKNSLLKKIVTARGGTPAPGDSLNNLLRKWLVAEGGTPHPSDSSNNFLRKILAARGGSPKAGDTCNDLLRKICGSGSARTIWDWLKSILDLFQTPPVDPGAWYYSFNGMDWTPTTGPEEAHILDPNALIVWMSQQAANPAFPSVGVNSLSIEPGEGYLASYGQVPTLYTIASGSWEDTAAGVQNWIDNGGNPFVEPPPELSWGPAPVGHLKVYHGDGPTETIWDPLGIYQFAVDATISGVTAMGCQNLSQLDVTQCANITSAAVVNCPVLTDFRSSGCANLADLGGANCPGLSSITCDGGALTSLDVLVFPALAYLDCSTNALTEAGVDAILAALIGNWVEAGTVDLSGGTNAPPSDPDGLASVAILEARFWTVSVNVAP